MKEKFAQKLDTMTVIDEDDSTDKAMKKVATMHALLSKQLMSLKMAKQQAAAKGKLDENMTKQFDQICSPLEKHVGLLSGGVAKTLKLEQVKKMLAGAALASKKAYGWLQDLQLQKK